MLSTPNGSLAESLDYIEQRHHAIIRGFLERIQGLIPEVMIGADQGAPQHALKPLKTYWNVLNLELGHHLQMEEKVVFPLIRNLEREPPSAPVPPEKDPAEHLRHLGHEHEYILRILSDIRRLTGIFNLPPHAAPALQEFYGQLRMMNADLNEHIAFEQTFIFPRVGRLAPGTGTGPANSAPG